MDRNVAYFSLNDTSKFAVIVSVVAAVLLGLPVWWKTTEVYRASLPLAETERLNSEIRANFSLNFPVVVYLQTERWGSYEEVKSWRINDFASRQLSTAFSAKPLVQGESLQKGWSDSDSGAQQAETVLLESHGSPNEQLSVFVLCAEAKVEQGNTRVWVGQRRSLLVETFCGQIRLLEDKVVPIVKVIVLHQAAQLNETKAGALLEMLDERPFPSTNGFAFESYQSILSKQLPFMSAFLGQPEVKRSVPSPHTREKKTRASLKAVKFAPQYQILFSLLVADPMTTGPVSWKVEKAYAETLQPFIDSLKGFLDIKVAFQVVRYAVPTVYAMPQFSETRNPETNETETFPFWTLTPESLAMFVNSAEWPLHSVVRAPILNFLLYIPPAEQTPLFITDGMGRSLETNAFLVSQWGGIVIRNYKMSGSDSVSLQDELTEVMEVWGNQLKDLLGIGSAFPDGAFQKVFHNGNVTVKVTSSSFAILEADRDLWSLKKTVGNLLDSVHTLSSLQKLVQSLNNMVVKDEIAATVEQSLLLAKEGWKRLKVFDNYESYALIRESLRLAEKAFFDPTMVPLLYFPDEHRLAIYMPFFIPALVPLLIILFKELKAHRSSLQKKLAYKRQS